MAITKTNGFKHPVLDGMDTLFDTGILEIRTGAPPGANQAPTGTVLASITLPADSFAAAASGSKAKNGTWQDASADAAGTAAHFRLKGSADGGGASETDPRLEGTVTATSGGGDMELDNVVIAAAQQVTINTFTLNG
jgi:hypothetical protein